jgi:hypothetical protein
MLCVLCYMQGLRQHADDPALQQAWRTVKQQAKQRAAAKIQALTGVKVNPNALFDIQVGNPFLFCFALLTSGSAARAVRAMVDCGFACGCLAVLCTLFNVAATAANGSSGSAFAGAACLPMHGGVRAIMLPGQLTKPLGLIIACIRSFYCMQHLLWFG